MLYVYLSGHESIFCISLKIKSFNKLRLVNVCFAELKITVNMIFITVSYYINIQYSMK